LKKSIPSNLGSQFAMLGANVPAFINIVMSNVLAFLSDLMPKKEPKMLKFGPKFFSAMTPSVMWAK
jgi:hypothetical protein